MTPVWLEPAAPRSRVRHSTTALPKKEMSVLRVGMFIGSRGWQMGVKKEESLMVLVDEGS